MRVFLLDNFDSFTFNLVDDLARRGAQVEVVRNTIAASDALATLDRYEGPRLLVLSPGPGRPTDAGCMIDLIQRAPQTLPILGVCLGHQAIVEAFGGEVGRAGEIVHGKTSEITHDGRGLYAHLTGETLRVARYHSLVATHVPDALEITARANQLVMGVRHKARPIHGVQFHPESILTCEGGRLLETMMDLASQEAR